jgi:hypothetical protein
MRDCHYHCYTKVTITHSMSYFSRHYCYSSMPPFCCNVNCYFPTITAATMQHCVTSICGSYNILLLLPLALRVCHHPHCLGMVPFGSWRFLHHSCTAVLGVLPGNQVYTLTTSLRGCYLYISLVSPLFRLTGYLSSLTAGSEWRSQKVSVLTGYLNEIWRRGCW